MKIKRPSFQFYPSDWLRDTALRSCSVCARGLWMDMLCFMHEGSPYGHLKVANKVILPANLAQMVGLTLDQVECSLKELRDAGVFDETEEGVIFSRRMIRDENIRNARASGGKLGGNPALMVKDKVNLPDNLDNATEDKQKPTPSSSTSSSSSSSNTEKKTTTAVQPFTVDDQVWNDFLALRKAKRAPLTETALNMIEKESEIAGLTLNDALTECVTRGWQSFKADWVKPKQQQVEMTYSRAC